MHKTFSQLFIWPLKSTFFNKRMATPEFKNDSEKFSHELIKVIHKLHGSMFILCPLNDTEKKLLQSKIRKASGIGSSIENPTKKRDASTCTEDIGVYTSFATMLEMKKKI